MDTNTKILTLAHILRCPLIVLSCLLQMKAQHLLLNPFHKHFSEIKLDKKQKGACTEKNTNRRTKTNYIKQSGKLCQYQPK